MKLPKRKKFRVSPLSFIPQKWRKAVAIVAVLVLVAAGPGAYFVFHQPGKVAAWFNYSWNYRQQVTLTVPSSISIATSIPVKLTINTSALISAGKLQSACQDLRFTNSVGTTLPYFLDSGCNTTTTKVWVQLDSIPASTTSYTLYMYYGNAVAAAGSDSSNTYNLNLYNGLVAYWTMNDGSGSTITDSSVNTFNGTFPGNDTFVAGKYSTGLNNTGTGAGANIPYTAGSGLDFSSSTHPSIAFWYKSSTAGQTARFMTGTSAQAWGIQILAGQWEINSFSGTTGYFPSANAPSDGIWHHFVITADGTTATIYQDGSLLSSVAFSPNWVSQSTSLYVLGDGAYNSVASLDDLRIYKRVLSSAEVTQLYGYSSSILTAAPATITPSAAFSSEQYPAADTATANTWYDTRWGFRQAATITNSSGGGLTNYQVKISVNTSRLISAGKLQSACQDLRVTDNTGQSLNYWIETGTNTCNTTTTNIWVKVPTIPTGASTVYVYYGNNTAAAAQNGNLTFDFFDDFSASTLNTQKWTATGAYSISGGTITITTGSVYTNAPVVASTQNELFEMNNNWSGTPTNYAGLTTSNAQSIQGGNAGLNKLAILMSNSASLLVAAWAADGATASYNVASFVSQFTATSAVNYISGFAYDSTNLHYFSNRTQTNAYATSVAYSPYLYLGHYQGTLSGTTAITPLTVDFVLARKYATTEPTTALAAEETTVAPLVNLKLDDGTGTAANNSGWGGPSMNGLLTNMSNPPTATSSWQLEDQCVSGKCLRFNGSTNFVTGTNPNVANNSFSISGWIFENMSPSGNETWFSMGNVPGTDTLMHMRITSTGQMRFGFYNDDLDSGVGIFTPGKWNHVEYTYNASTKLKSIYLNGNLVTSGTAAGSYNGASVYNIGSLNLAEYWSGKIDEVKMYGYARSAAQVKSDFNLTANTTGKLVQSSLSNGLVGYWKFDEGTGSSATDWSGSGNTGTWNGTLGSQWTNGKYGGAGNFNGTDNYVGVPKSLFSTTTNFSISAWVKGGVVGGNERLIAAKTGFFVGLELNPNGDGRVCMRDWDSVPSGSFVACEISQDPNNWHHYVGEFIGNASTGTLYLYKDGLLQSTAAMSSVYNDPGLFYIGGVFTNYEFPGQIDEVRVYNRALSAGEVDELYNFAPRPVGYWDMNERTGSSAFDSSGYGNTGTWTGKLGSQWTNGKYGGAGNFNGTDNYINFSNVLGLATNSNVTISGWAYIPSATDNGAFVKIGNSTTGYGIGVGTGSFNSAGNHLLVLYESVRWIDTGVNISTGWHHFALVIQPVTGYPFVYLDGNQIYTDTGLVAITPVTQSGIGGYGFSGRYYTGKLDDVRVYNYARTQAQIQQDMRGDSSIVPEISLVGGSASGSAQTKPASPVGIWHFDEGYGTTANNAGSGGTSLNGTLTNMASPATSASGWQNASSGNCKINGCLAFDGTNDYVNLGQPSALAFERTSQFSISTWIKGTSFAGLPTIFSKGLNSGSYTGYFFFLNAGKLEMQINNTGSATNQIDVKSNNTVSTGVWHHVVMTYDGSSSAAGVKFYVDDVIQGVTVLSNTLSASILNAADANIGEYADASSPFNGLIDEVHVYNFALNQDQVNTDYNYGSSLTSGVLGPTEAANDLSGGAGNPPLGYWSFNERSGSTVSDRSGNGNTGNWQGTLGKQWTIGKVGAAGSFNGTDNYVSTTTNYGNGSGFAQFTEQAWFKTTVASGDIIAMENQQTGTGSPQNDRVLFITAAGKLSFYYVDSSGHTITTTPSFNDGKWHFASATSDGTTTNLYVDGVLQVSGAGGGYTSYPSSYWRIGAYSVAGYFTGQIDEVKVYNYVRTQAQVAYDYNRGAPVGWWKFDENQGTLAHDSSGFANTGTWVGTLGSQWGTGKFNTDGVFNGADNYVNVADSNSLRFGTGDLTLAAWIKAPAANQFGPIIAKRNNSPYQQIGMFVGSEPSGAGTAGKQIGWFVYDGSTPMQSYHTANNIVDGNWHHIVGLRRNGVVSIYVDGLNQTLVADNASTSSVNFDCPVPLEIGSENGTAFLFNGSIDDVRVYNYALSATQIRKIMNDGSTMFYGPAIGSP